MRARLGKDLSTLSPRSPDKGGALGSGHVKYDNGLIDKTGELDKAMKSLDFGRSRMAYGVVFRIGVASRNQSFAHPFQHAMVLSMNADESSMLTRSEHHIEEA